MYNTNKGLTPIKITINGQEYDYTIKYQGESDNNWTHKLIDKYRFDTIGGVKCFIKRAYKNPPSGWELMKKLTGQSVEGMPKVYFTGESKNDINTHSIYFTIISAENGQTLKEAVLASKSYDVKKLLKNIAVALHFIHKQGYWFSDLNDQNIFLLDTGDFVLIDVDSCWKDDIKPNPIANTTGWIPSESYRYANLAMDFYKKYLPQFSGITYENLGGKYLNFLQLIVICGKFQFYAEAKNSNPNTDYLLFFSKGKNDIVLKSLLDRNPSYLKAIFTYAYNQNIDDTIFYKTILGFDKFINQQVISLPPVFILTPSIQFSTDKPVINEKETIRLSWTVKNATSITLEGNGLIRRSINPNDSITIRNVEKSSTYTIIATNQEGTQITKEITVQVNKVVVPTFPSLNLINEFTVDSNKVKRGNSISLKWQISPQAQWLIVDISKLPQNYKTELETEKVREQSWQELTKLTNAIITKGNATNTTTYQEDTKMVIPTNNTTYALVAKNNNSISSKIVTISIEENKSSNLKKFAAAILILIVAFVGLQYTVYQNYEEQIRQARSKADNQAYGEAVELAKEAEHKENILIIFSKDYSFYKDIRKWNMYDNIQQGNNLFKKGDIASVSFLTSVSDFALDKYQNAKLYDDESSEELKIMLDLAEQIKRGSQLYDEDENSSKQYFLAHDSYANTLSYMSSLPNLDSNLIEGLKLYMQRGRKNRKIYIEYLDVKKETEKLMIRSNIRVHFTEDENIRVEVYFFDENNVPLPDKDRAYSKDKKVMEYEELTLTELSINPEEVYLSIPYEQLHISSNKTHNLKIKMIVFDNQYNKIDERDYAFEILLR